MGGEVPWPVLTGPLALSSVPAAAARPCQAGQLPARAPGARAGPRAAAARVPPPLSGRRSAHAGRLRPAAQAARRERERRGGAGRGGQTRQETLTAPLARRRCARTSAKLPSPLSCAASAATWTAPCRRRSSSTRVPTAPRSWRRTGPSCAPASAPRHLPTRLQPHKGTSAPVSAKGHRRDQRPSVSATTERPPWAAQLQTTAHEDRQEKPVGGVRSISLLLGDGRTGLGSQTSQARVGRQDGWGGWGAKPRLGNSGPEGGPHILQLCPGADRPPPTSLAIVWGLHH